MKTTQFTERGKRAGKLQAQLWAVLGPGQASWQSLGRQQRMREEAARSGERVEWHPNHGPHGQELGGAPSNPAKPKAQMRAAKERIQDCVYVQYEP